MGVGTRAMCVMIMAVGVGGAHDGGVAAAAVCKCGGWLVGWIGSYDCGGWLSVRARDWEGNGLCVMVIEAATMATHDGGRCARFREGGGGWTQPCCRE